AAGVVLRVFLAPLAVADFVVGVNAVQEYLAMTLDHLSDAHHVDDIGPDANDHHSRRIERCILGRLVHDGSFVSVRTQQKGWSYLGRKHRSRTRSERRTSNVELRTSNGPRR